MTSNNTESKPRGGLADKRRAILRGGLAVFGRDGYTRASIDAISSEAGVSTRTIYNHFRDKADLFQCVIQESAARVAASQIGLIERHLTKVTDLEADLVAFARALSAPMSAEYADHFSLVRQINADSEHLPASAIQAWQETGPLRFRREFAKYLAAFADRGLLRAGDPERAALHFLVLVSVSNPSLPHPPRSKEEVDKMVTAGVHAFLHGYLP